jgi:hypothetical protein
MKVFISWSGPRSQQIAEQLRSWLRLILPAVKPFISSADVDKGAKWQGELLKELADCKYGIVCLTPDNLTSPWILFESGALSKHLDSRVATLLFRVPKGTVAQPLGMFQATEYDKEDIRKLIHNINKNTGDVRPDQEMDTVFDAMWHKLSEPLDLILAEISTIAQEIPPTDLTALITEMLSLVREQHQMLSNPDRLAEAIDEKILTRARRTADNDLTTLDLAQLYQRQFAESFARRVRESKLPSLMIPTEESRKQDAPASKQDPSNGESNPPS